jgi:hypothetical protein
MYSAAAASSARRVLSSACGEGRECDARRPQPPHRCPWASAMPRAHRHEVRRIATTAARPRLRAPRAHLPSRLAGLRPILPGNGTVMPAHSSTALAPSQRQCCTPTTAHVPALAPGLGPSQPNGPTARSRARARRGRPPRSRRRGSKREVDHVLEPDRQQRDRPAADPGRAPTHTRNPPGQAASREPATPEVRADLINPSRARPPFSRWSAVASRAAPLPTPSGAARAASRPVFQQGDDAEDQKSPESSALNSAIQRPGASG